MRELPGFSRIKTVFQCIIGKMKSSGDLDTHWLDLIFFFIKYVIRSLYEFIDEQNNSSSQSYIKQSVIAPDNYNNIFVTNK